MPKAAAAIGRMISAAALVPLTPSCQVSKSPAAHSANGSRLPSSDFASLFAPRAPEHERDRDHNDEKSCDHRKRKIRIPGAGETPGGEGEPEHKAAEHRIDNERQAVRA